MIKNWTVITKPVINGSNGVALRERYLTSKNHPNHKNTTEITSLTGDKFTSKTIALIGEQYKLRQQLNKNAGRHLSSYAMEYCLTLPKGITATNTQWIAIINVCCKALFDICDLDDSQKFYFKKIVRSVLHRQDQNIASGTGDHVHLLIGKVISGKGTRVLKELQQKKATKALKTAFNIAVIKHLGLNYRDYTPSELNRGKRLETWKYHNNKTQKKLDKTKTIRQLQIQADKWFKAFEENDYKQANRQFNRIKKSHNKLFNIEISNNEKASINQIISKIETKSGRKILE
ncbi:hypothetical protein [Photobacterium sanguinicancri]|uniref:Replication protein n=1 Tax=Photobacterium sanguinicancri TaxID=875932 RepID=A0AAW7Y8N3_9GAMM|nr:hypothetical protein [Photobacterium sanguinicancri]MDO6543688.1 hypothetical protein [Photobacterium sanguinicancri]